MDSDAIAFSVREPDRPRLEVRVNFGVFAGRNATQAEIDDLAGVLHDEVGVVRDRRRGTARVRRLEARHRCARS